MEKILTYLQEQLDYNNDALNAWNSSIKDDDVSIRMIREIEIVKLKDRIAELTRHISFIKHI